MHRIGLDLAVKQIERRVDAWRAAGLEVDPVTWRDIGEPWPYPFKTNRAEVKHADSIGVALRKDVPEGSVVLFDGGWADFTYWSGVPPDNPFEDAPGWNDWLTVDKFGGVLDRLANMFT